MVSPSESHRHGHDCGHDHHDPDVFGHEHPCGDSHSLEVSGLHVHYGSICALEDVKFRANCGQSIALLGRNGAGKSTLLKVIAGLIPGHGGEVRWSGSPLDDDVRRREVAYLPQREEVDWNFPVTVRGLVEMGRYPHLGMFRRFSKADAEAVDAAIEALQLGKLQKRQIRELSGGQQQRAFIARALAAGSHVLLLDEPFTGLDRPAQDALADLMGELVAGGRLVIASHHDLRTVGELFSHALLLNRSQVAFGAIENVCTDELIASAFGNGEESVRSS